MRFKLSKRGVHLPYYGDALVFNWPWCRKIAGRYSSSIYGRDFGTLREYWSYAGASAQLAVHSLDAGKMGGFDIPEVLGQWTNKMYPDEYVMVLVGADTSKKDATFWQRVPKTQHIHWGKDFQLLRCSDRTELLNLAAGISEGFAECYCFFNGQLIDTNRWS